MNFLKINLFVINSFGYLDFDYLSNQLYKSNCETNYQSRQYNLYFLCIIPSNYVVQFSLQFIILPFNKNKLCKTIQHINF